MQSSFTSYSNIGVIEELYASYREDPNSVDASWRYFFEGMELGMSREAAAPAKSADLRVYLLVEAYRTHGHLLARFNPVDPHPRTEVKELTLASVGLDDSALDQSFPTFGFLPESEAPLRAIVDALQKTYCGSIGIEYKGLQAPEMELWIQRQIEPTHFAPAISVDQKRRILDGLNKAELFEVFLHTKYVGQKRFSLEGGETLIPLLEMLIDEGAGLGVEEIVFAMAHRGRLNVLANVLNKSYANIFHEFEDTLPEVSWEGSGDVKYHKGFSAEVTALSGRKIHLSMAANPSHLESVDPVVEGKTRAKQDAKGTIEEMRHRVVPLLIHGDAAVASQGVVYETMQMSKLTGYGVGGTIHIVINNQIGFTTLPKDGRSTLYCTDIARAFSVPVFHVSSEDPEGCAYVARLAMRLRREFRCDVFIDLNCYRKYGHNEADEPAFTQPLEYQIIAKKKSPRVIYRDRLIESGVVERQIAEQLEVEFRSALQAELDAVQAFKTEAEPDETPPKWTAIREANRSFDPFEQEVTAVDEKTLVQLADRFCQIPDGFNLHRKLVKLVEDRRAMMKGNPSEKHINWGLAEHLAFASLLNEGVPIRLSGQDSRRGTFNHRHAMWMDQVKEGKYFPLSHLREGQGRFCVFNSPLSEFAVLGFEFGYSLCYPDSLVIWEAQFGDFANSAQVVIDQYLCTSEQKWGQFSGLVLLLPHGYEGQGPEHSSGRIERFLQLAAESNLQVVNASTPAQLFHLFRRQMKRKSRKPLVVFTPKSLLGHPRCVSALSEFSNGTFEEILDDPEPPKSVRRVALCSGRIYYDLIEQRQKRGSDDIVIIRVEQFYPFNADRLKSLLNKYSAYKECCWVQEEPANMGAWEFLHPQLEEIVQDKPLLYIGRPKNASPATGSLRKHRAQQNAIYDSLFQ